jgi:hypothetical protein
MTDSSLNQVNGMQMDAQKRPIAIVPAYDVIDVSSLNPVSVGGGRENISRHAQTNILRILASTTRSHSRAS